MTTIEQTIGCPYEGIPSFGRFPICFDISTLDADVAVTGICLDSGTTYRSGTRFGPKAIRESSMLYSEAYFPQGFFDVDQGRYILGGVKVVDCGDITTLPTLLGETFELITSSINSIRKRNAIPVVLGGDHSISYPILRAFSDEKVHVFHFDSHLDLVDNFAGLRFTHANPMRRAIEMDHICGLTQIGIRGLLNPPEVLDDLYASKSKFFTANQVHDQGVMSIVEQIPKVDNLYLSVDIDCLDPSVAPGTGTPEFGGLSYLQLSTLLRECVKKGKLVGLDLVEVNPLFDSTGMTAQVAARLIIDILGSAFNTISP